MTSISLEQCWLTLPVYGTGSRSFKQKTLSAVSGGKISSNSGEVAVVHALRNASLELRSGDRVGLVGHNGSGKTSLLRVLSGIYEPTAGRITVDGKVTSLLDVTLGMDHEATGYENIRLRALILGLSRRELERRLPEIVEFSGLGDFLHMPVRTYSSGMVLRLAFSTVTCIQPDILLMDEWLSVGDLDFIAKAERRLKSIVDGASILVLASHNPKIIDDLCNMVIRLEHGEIVQIERKSD